MIKAIIYFLVRNRFLTYFLFIAITAATLSLTLLPADKLGESNLYEYDKLGHFMLFFFWTLAFGFLLFTKKQSNTSIIVVFLIGSGFGISVELLQAIMPAERHPDLYDAAADVLGSFSASVLLYLIKQKYLQSLKK